MFGAGFISFIVAIGASGWIYSKVQRRTGNNTGMAVKTALVCALAIWLVGFFVISALIKK